MTQETNEYRERRLENLRELQALGRPGFGGAFERSGGMGWARDAFREGAAARLAGRLAAWRDMGKSVFAHLQDATGRFQVYFQQAALGPGDFAACRRLDLGDWIGVEGEMFTTRTGEPTLKVHSWTLLAKALRQPPEKWHGLQDAELRIRRRYLDLVARPELCQRFRLRSRILSGIRRFLDGRGFQEVETPMMQPVAGGAAARPFETYYHALQRRMFLRIAPELYLKRLLVGGLDKVYELNRNFRNEGVDRSHNPEFTMLEIYEAFGDRHTMQRLITEMVCEVARETLGGWIAGPPDRPVNLEPPWREATYAELVREAAGEDWDALGLDAARERVAALGLAADPAWDKLALGHEIYEKRVERTLIQPTFVTRLPARLIPLARVCEDDPGAADVFELVIDGKEIAPAYTELNDPVEQRRRLVEQAGGDAGRVDEEFLEALEHGMPPAGGMGVGIDRLVMILTGAESIREVILFPQLRGREADGAGEGGGAPPSPPAGGAPA